jgi:response regulator RpfG family c-di-GMP phosphodiesterase
MAERPSILCVDDEISVLEGLTDTLRRHFKITVESSPQAALDLLARETFTVLVSDMRMPEMDGAELLARARVAAPDTTRILLTGQTDLQSAIRAVNEGAIFRFLTKPCRTDDLVSVIAAAAAHHDLVTAERVLLQQTLTGALEALAEVLALADPQVFGRSTRVKQYAAQLATAAGAQVWKVELAATLLHLGYVALPEPLATRLAAGETLDNDDLTEIARLPLVAEQLLRQIPRLEDIRHILQTVPLGYDPANPDRVILEARALAIAIDYELLESQGIPPELAMATLRGRTKRYDPRLLDAWSGLIGAGTKRVVVELRLDAVKPGMVFAEDVRGANGTLLIARGFTVSVALTQRLHTIAEGHTGQLVRMIIDAGQPGAKAA